MGTGEKIKKYRKMRGMTQQQLGETLGFGESAVRNYEHDYRSPGPEQLEAIARVLGISVEALEDYDVASARGAMESLFRLEEAYGLRPTEDGSLTIDPKAKGAQKLSMALKAWQGVLAEVESGDMTEGEYELWKASFSA